VLDGLTRIEGRHMVNKPLNGAVVAVSPDRKPHIRGQASESPVHRKDPPSLCGFYVQWRSCRSGFKRSTSTARSYIRVLSTGRQRGTPAELSHVAFLRQPGRSPGRRLRGNHGQSQLLEPALECGTGLEHGSDSKNVAELRASGHSVKDEDLARVSPLLRAHVISNGSDCFPQTLGCALDLAPFPARC
jgi:hypothetical protein